MTLANIRFVSFLGVDVDSDLLPYWISHYKKLRFDSYTVFLHQSLIPLKNDYAYDLLHDAGFDIRWIDHVALAPREDGQIPLDVAKVFHLENFAKQSHHKPDFLCVADGDEFQEWNRFPHEEIERGIGVVLGTLVDRFDDTLHNPREPLSLERNYPISHENLSSLFMDTPYLTLKYCMFPSAMPINYIGCHAVKLGQEWKGAGEFTTGPIEVKHYRWRKSVIERVKNRFYWSDESTKKVLEFFAPKENV